MAVCYYNLKANHNLQSVGSKQTFKGHLVIYKINQAQAANMLWSL